MRVLILSCNTGEGHNSCGKAIQEVFRENGIYCEMEDALRFISPRVSSMISFSFVKIYRYTPGLFRNSYQYLEEYLVFPNCQELRPAAFERDNVFTRILANYYQFDTNTNVCPSLHVIGSVAVWCASWHIRPFQTPVWKIAFSLSAVLICVSTVFLKQHSIVDIFAAIPVCLLAYHFSFGRRSLAGT